MFSNSANKVPFFCSSGTARTLSTLVASTSYDRVPLEFILNFAIPVAGVLTGGSMFFPLRVATKVDCCCAKLKPGLPDTTTIRLASIQTITIFELTLAICRHCTKYLSYKVCSTTVLSNSCYANSKPVLPPLKLENTLFIYPYTILPDFRCKGGSLSLKSDF